MFNKACLAIVVACILLSSSSCEKFKDCACSSPALNETFGDSSYVFIANAITPNWDGLNDRLYIHFLPTDVVAIEVKNSKGNVVASNLDTVEYWTGQKEYYVDVRDKGCYTYAATITTHSGIPYFWKGEFTVFEEADLYKCINKGNDCQYGDQWQGPGQVMSIASFENGPGYCQ